MRTGSTQWEWNRPCQPPAAAATEFVAAADADAADAAVAAVQRCSAVEGNQDPRYWRPRRAHGLHGRVVLQVIRIRVGQDGWARMGEWARADQDLFRRAFLVARCGLETRRGGSLRKACRDSQSRRGRAGMGLLSVERRASSVEQAGRDAEYVNDLMVCER